MEEAGQIRPNRSIIMPKVDKQQTSNGKMPGGITGKGWMPGQSGNPNGRQPKVRSIPDILHKIGDEEGTVSGKYTKLDVVLRKVFDFALEGKSWAVQFIAYRTEGKPREFVEQKITRDEVVIK